jgi:hypothetical protein
MAIRVITKGSWNLLEMRKRFQEPFVDSTSVLAKEQVRILNSGSFGLAEVDADDASVRMKLRNAISFCNEGL